jgi:protein DA1
MRHGLRCVVCEEFLGLTWTRDHFGEWICKKCVLRARCWSCSANTGGTRTRAGTALSDGRIRCARCSKWAVDHQSDVGAVVQLVRPLLHSYGVRLPNQVRVDLVEPHELRAGAGTLLHGRTVVEPGRLGGASRVRSIKVVAGMPATQFGQVVAHEMGHGWLTLCPGRRSSATEEGICELIGSWWLRHRGGRLAAYYLDQMMRNPDPVYGDGYRSAYRKAGDVTPAEVVRQIERTGRL